MLRSPAAPLTFSARVRESAKSAAWSAGLYAGVAGVGALLAQHRGASLATQVFAAEWGAGRLGVSWSDPEAPLPRTSDVLARLGKGAAIGAVSAIALLAAAAGTGSATFGPPRPVSLDLAIGLLVALFTAARDELLLRGVVLKTFRHTLGVRGRLLVSGAIAAAAHVGHTSDEPLSTLFSTTPTTPTTGAVISLVAAFCGGVCFAALWLRDRGAFLPCGAHAAWTVLTTTVISGGLWTTTWRDGLWGGGGLETSLVFTVGLAVLAGLALVVLLRRDARG